MGARWMFRTRPGWKSRLLLLLVKGREGQQLPVVEDLLLTSEDEAEAGGNKGPSVLRPSAPKDGRVFRRLKSIEFEDDIWMPIQYGCQWMDEWMDFEEQPHTSPGGSFPVFLRPNVAQDWRQVWWGPMATQ